MECIEYRAGYNYRLHKDAVFQTDIRPDRNAISEFVTLTRDGLLKIKAGYHWDGASGPAHDTKSNMRASLAHDALYGLLREGLLLFRHRKDADALYQELNWKDARGWRRRTGYEWMRSWWSWGAVRIRGDNAIESPSKPVLYAPEGCP